MVVVANRKSSRSKYKAGCWKLIATFVLLSCFGFMLFFYRHQILDMKRDDHITTKLSAPAVASSSLTVPERDFLKVAKLTGTDKVAGYDNLPICLKDPNSCIQNLRDSERKECRTWGHFYDTMYNKWLKPYSTDDVEPFQFLEIGYYNGKGFDAYSEFLPRAEAHSMEISCLEHGPREEGKWPWGNFAEVNPKYESLRKMKKLHCGDASDYEFLHNIWMTEMKRPDAPPLKVVVDDGSHLAQHMAASLFFWIPRIEPGGMLVVEDVQPISAANEFRTHILPQVMKDVHWCGSSETRDTLCFPTIQPFLAGVHCEMHICIFFRNNIPSTEPGKEASIVPNNAFTNAQRCLFGPHN